jgi:hypothetical protein
VYDDIIGYLVASHSGIIRFSMPEHQSGYKYRATKANYVWLVLLVATGSRLSLRYFKYHEPIHCRLSICVQNRYSI